MYTSAIVNLQLLTVQQVKGQRIEAWTVFKASSRQEVEIWLTHSVRRMTSNEHVLVRSQGEQRRPVFALAGTCSLSLGPQRHHLKEVLSSKYRQYYDKQYH
jgi:hypothetical protein